MKDIKSEFAAFSLDSQTPADPELLREIHAQIIVPSPARAALKLFIAHLVSSIVVLSACPQFGVRLFFSGHGLMHYFMKISPTFCLSFCGALYLATTFLVGRILLSRDEFLLILRSKVLFITALGLLSLAGFAIYSHAVTYQDAIFWFFGAILGAEFASLRARTVQRFFAAI